MIQTPPLPYGHQYDLSHLPSNVTVTFRRDDKKRAALLAWIERVTAKQAAAQEQTK
jgi:hypothetical protein